MMLNTKNVPQWARFLFSAGGEGSRRKPETRPHGRAFGFQEVKSRPTPKMRPRGRILGVGLEGMGRGRKAHQHIKTQNGGLLLVTEALRFVFRHDSGAGVVKNTPPLCRNTRRRCCGHWKAVQMLNRKNAPHRAHFSVWRVEGRVGGVGDVSVGVGDVLVRVGMYWWGKGRAGGGGLPVSKTLKNKKMQWA